MQRRTERRAHPRVGAKLPLVLDPSGAVEVMDISRSGVRCVVPAPLPPMTLVKLLLEIPSHEAGVRSEATVSCQGAVVRSRRNEGGRHELAILFQGLSEADEELIGSYVKSRLAQL